MYEIYIKDRQLVLASKEEVKSGKALLGLPKETLKVPYRGQPKSLHPYIDMLEKKSPTKAVLVYGPDLKQLRRDFFSLYHKIRAAGGLVGNKRGELLFIFRRGMWDLPKGKIGEGETKKQAALREVEEETGVKDLKLGPKLAKTYHTFSCQKAGYKRCLKVVHWYKMWSDQKVFLPQEAEQIEKVQWMDPHFFLKSKLPTFHSIKHLVEMYVQSEEG